MEIAQSQKFEGMKIDSLQALRGIAALFVAAQHISWLYRGAFGVESFFLISGFIVMYSTQKESRHFLTKRFIRVIPLYYLFTFIAFALLLLFPNMFWDTKQGIVPLIKSLLFIPYEQGFFVMPLMRVGWTVNYEILFYLIFFISMKISHKYRGLISSGVLVVLSIIGYVFPNLIQPWKFWTDCFWLEFAVGILSFYLFKWIYEKAPRVKALALALIVVSVALFGFLWWVSGRVELLEISRILFFGIPSLLIYICIFYIGCCFKIPKFLVKLGDISYSFYFIHYYPIRLISRETGYDARPGFLQVVITLAVLAACIGAAYVSYLLIEVKFTNWLKKIIIRK